MLGLHFYTYIFKLINLFIVWSAALVFLAVHRLSLVLVCRLLVALASLVAEHKL